jgi:N-acetylneuraminic acid mutarotase
VVDGIVYLVGGVGTDGSIVATVHAYNPQTNTWSMRAAMPTPREHLGAAAIDGKLYAVGGRMQSLASNSAVMEVYDPVTNKWSPGADLPTARGGITAIAYHGRLLVVGGEGGDGTFSEVEAYDPTTDSWSSLEPTPEPRHGLGSGVARGRVYILLGGPEPGLTVSGTVVSLGP